MENIKQLLARINSLSVPRRLKPRWKVMAGPVLLFFVPVIIALLMHGDIVSSLAGLYGKEAQAEIEQTTTWITHGKHSSTTHYGAFVNYPHPGNTHRARVELGNGLYGRISPGDRVGIRYFEWAPQYPNAGYFRAAVVIMPALMMLICAAIGTWLLRSHYVLLGSGFAVAGRVERVIKGSKNTYTWMVAYTYNGLTTVKDFNGTQNAPDETVVVLNPAKPDKAGLYENLCWKLDDDVLN